MDKPIAILADNYKRVVACSYQDAPLHGPCVELKDMDSEKQGELVKYYTEKYFKVKGKTTRVPLGKLIYKDYLVNRTYYRVWID